MERTDIGDKDSVTALTTAVFTDDSVGVDGTILVVSSKGCVYVEVILYLIVILKLGICQVLCGIYFILKNNIFHFEKFIALGKGILENLVRWGSGFILLQRGGWGWLCPVILLHLCRIPCVNSSDWTLFCASYNLHYVNYYNTIHIIRL